MVPAVLKLYFFGTALSVLAVLFEIANSFGGLMYPQDQHYILELQQQQKKEGRQEPEGLHHQRSLVPTKRIGS